VGAAQSEPELTVDERDVTVRSAAVMSTGTLVSRATGLVRVTVTLAALGLTTLSDTYNAANTTPNIVYELLLGGILTSIFVPVFVDHVAQRADERWDVANRILTVTVVVLAFAALVGILAAPWIMRLYLSGVPEGAERDQQVALGTFFLRWFLPQMVFYGITAVASGILTAHRRFVAQSYAPVLNNMAVIVTMLAFLALQDGAAPTIDGLSAGERTLLAAGTTLGVVAMALALWPAIHRLGFRLRPRLDVRHEAIRSLLRLAKWVVVYVVANQVAYLLIINLNQRVEPGAYTAYSQAFIFFSLPHAIVAVSIVTTLLAGLAERWTRSDVAGTRELFSRGLRDTEVAMLPAATGFVALAGPIVALLADYGAVSTEGVDLLTATLTAFAVGLPFFSAFQLLTRTFYATQDSRTPALVNIGAAVVNIAVAVLLGLVLDLGVPGLALGHAASYAVGSVVLFLLLRRRLAGADGRRVASTVLRATAAAAVSGVAAFLTAEAIAAAIELDRPLTRLLQVAAGIAVGVLVFGVAALMMRVREVDEVRTALFSRFRR
jgi:putative peptidoglycan lipid II flippase